MMISHAPVANRVDSDAGIYQICVCGFRTPYCVTLAETDRFMELHLDAAKELQETSATPPSAQHAPDAYRTNADPDCDKYRAYCTCGWFTGSYTRLCDAEVELGKHIAAAAPTTAPHVLHEPHMSQYLKQGVDVNVACREYIGCCVCGYKTLRYRSERGARWALDSHINAAKVKETATTQPPVADSVNHPTHYGGDTPHEVIKCLCAWGLEHDALLWNTVKYIARAGKKRTSDTDKLTDLKKARFYLDQRIIQLVSVEETEAGKNR